ncbi:MAG: sigma-70 family RNA polymerase sigma factor [Bacteroidota bacterium]
MGNTDKIFDGLLVLQYRSGNKKALSLLVKRHHIKLCRHSYGYTHNIEMSKDIVQDCWYIIINKISTLKDPNSFGGWALKIVTRKTLDHLAREKQMRKKEEGYSMVTNDDENTGGNRSDTQELLKTIQTLPKQQQTVIRLFYTEEYSLKEMGQILGVSEGTIKSRLFHAREKLKTILKIKKDGKKQ